MRNSTLKILLSLSASSFILFLFQILSFDDMLFLSAPFIFASMYQTIKIMIMRNNINEAYRKFMESIKDKTE